jgi:hypothetical protein
MAIETIEQAPATPAPEAAPAAPAAPAPAPAAPAAPAEERYIDIDEATLASLPPELRQQVVDPLLTKLQSQVKDRITKEREGAKPFQKKAETLEKLIQQPWFQKAYYEAQNPQRPAAQPEPAAPAAPAISAQEWTAAYEKAAQGDMTTLNNLQEKQLDALVKQKYAPIIEKVQTKTRELEMTMELNDLFTNHADAKELDSIRIDPANSRSASLLEMALHYVYDKGKGSMEEAYTAARRMADQLKVQAKSAAMGMVQEKKAAITEAPSRAQVAEEGVVYVDTAQQALRQQLMATINKQNVTYRVRPRQK